MEIREITVNDKKAYYEMMLLLDRETEYMMYEPGERQVGEAAFRAMLQDARHMGSYILVAEDKGRLIGIIEAQRGCYKRIHHVAYISIGIIEEYCGQGIGKQLFQKVEDWAKSHYIKRLELTVMCRNEAALALYKKVGFEIEGMRAQSMYINKKYIDEYYMAKLL